MDFKKIVRFLTNELNDKEKDDFIKKIASDSDYNKKFKQIEDIWKKSSQFQEFKELDFYSDWELVRSRLKPKFKLRSKKMPLTAFMLRAAIILLLASGLGLGLYKISSLLPKTERISFSSDAAAREVTLPDGTVVTLNKNSSFSIDNRFNKNNRELFFAGEAFFDVTKNSGLPFVIRTGNSTIQVTGTSFNIKEDTSHLRVTVVSGRVSLYETKNRNNHVELIKNETASFEYATNKIIYGQNSNMNFLTWKTGRFEFFKIPTVDVLAVIADHFDKKLIINIPLKDSITGIFENQPLNEILKEIALTSSIIIDNIQEYIIVRK